MDRRSFGQILGAFSLFPKEETFKIKQEKPIKIVHKEDSIFPINEISCSGVVPYDLYKKLNLTEENK